MSVVLDVRERVAGCEPSRFWDAAPEPDAWATMVDKYASLARLAGLAHDRRTPALRDASARWPGSLREAELIGPERVDARAAAAAAGCRGPARPRKTWTEEPAIAVLCWASLHPLLLDLRRFRASPAFVRGDSQAFADWIAAQPGADARWPEPARIPAIVGPTLRVRSAYLWSAAQAGLDLPSLNALLLARAGHWDCRLDDPLWAHAVV